MKKLVVKYKFFDLFRQLYVLCDKSGNLKIYNFNEEKFVFTIKASEFDVDGWSNLDGFAFKEKLYILDFSVDVLWRKIRLKDILYLTCKYKFLFPYQILISVHNKKVSKYISRKNLMEPILLYSEVLG